MYDATDAKNAVIPHVCLASKDESTNVAAEYKAIFDEGSLGSYVDMYSTMHHSWIGARVNLDDAENKKEFELNPRKRKKKHLLTDGALDAKKSEVCSPNTCR